MDESRDFEPRPSLRDGEPVPETVRLTEVDGRVRVEFEPRPSLRDGEPDPETVRLTEVDGRVRVELVVTPYGMPRRKRRPPAVWISRGEWVRWQINYRFPNSWRGDWSYRLDTLNLAYAPTTVEIFTGEPTRYVDERAHLR